MLQLTALIVSAFYIVESNFKWNYNKAKHCKTSSLQPYGHLPTHKRKVSGARHFVTAMHYFRIASITRKSNISINTVDDISRDIIAPQTITPEDLDQLR